MKLVLKPPARRTNPLRLSPLRQRIRGTAAFSAARGSRRGVSVSINKHALPFQTIGKAVPFHLEFLAAAARQRTAHSQRLRSQRRSRTVTYSKARLPPMPKPNSTISEEENRLARSSKK